MGRVLVDALHEKHWLFVYKWTHNKVTILMASNKQLLLYLIVVLMTSFQPESVINYSRKESFSLTYASKLQFWMLYGHLTSQQSSQWTRGHHIWSSMYPRLMFIYYHPTVFDFEVSVSLWHDFCICINCRSFISATVDDCFAVTFVQMWITHWLD